MNKPKYQFINSLTLKIIAVISMTFDHIGLLLSHYLSSNPGISLTGDIFRILGRLSMPLIAVCFAEAMRYTKDREHYMSRLGLMAVIILITEIVLKYTVGNAFGGNIFLLLLCSATFIYFYEKKNKNKYLFFIPLVVILLSTTSEIYKGFNGSYLSFYPDFLIAQYSIYGFILCIGFYFLYKVSDARVKSLTEGTGRTIEELRQYPYYRSFTNIIWCFLLGGLTFFLFILRLINPAFDIYQLSRQSYALIAIIPILLYNGNKGYKSKKLQYSFYIYYPLHIIILFLSFFLVFGKV